MTHRRPPVRAWCAQAAQLSKVASEEAAVRAALHGAQEQVVEAEGRLEAANTQVTRPPSPAPSPDG